MTPRWTDWPKPVLETLRRGVAIPAHPLALDATRKIDPVRQRALTRSTSTPAPVGSRSASTRPSSRSATSAFISRCSSSRCGAATEWTDVPQVMIAGLSGRTDQARKEAHVARDLGYHAGLLSLAAFQGASEDELIAHATAVAADISLVGFYLQPAVGGIRAAGLVLAVVSPRLRTYRGQDCTLQPLSDARRGARRGAGRCRRPGHALHRQRRPYRARPAHAVSRRSGRPPAYPAHQGRPPRALERLGKKAVELLDRIHTAVAADDIPADLLALDAQVTDANAAVFDAANNFHGVIAGCHEILRRQGLLAGIWCLDPNEGLGPGQREAIDRVCAAYPHLTDDEFVRTNRERWLG